MTISQSAAGLKTFFLSMTLHPSALALAQEELDRVVGKNRLPSFQDRENLPYVNALIKEVLRWETIVPTGMHGLARLYLNSTDMPLYKI